MTNPYRDSCRGTHNDEESDVCMLHAAWSEGYTEAMSKIRRCLVAWDVRDSDGHSDSRRLRDAHLALGMIAEASGESK